MFQKEVDHRRRPVVADGIAEVAEMDEKVDAAPLQQADRLRRGLPVAVAVGDDADPFPIKARQIFLLTPMPASCTTKAFNHPRTPPVGRPRPDSGAAYNVDSIAGRAFI